MLYDLASGFRQEYYGCYLKIVVVGQARKQQDQKGGFCNNPSEDQGDLIQDDRSRGGEHSGFWSSSEGGDNRIRGLD